MKNNGNVRLWFDMRVAKRAVGRERHGKPQAGTDTNRILQYQISQ